MGRGGGRTYNLEKVGEISLVPTPLHCTPTLHHCIAPQHSSTAPLHYTLALHPCTASLHYTPSLLPCTAPLHCTPALLYSVHPCTAFLHYLTLCLRIKTKPVTVGADATVYVRLLFTNICPQKTYKCTSVWRISILLLQS